MVRFFNKLRIGEKIGLSFGLVGLLFLGVIWQYQTTLKQSLSDYQRLLDVFEAKKSFALNIERFMLEARRAEMDFLIHRKEAAVDRVAQYVGRVEDEAAKLKKIDAEALAVGDKISKFLETYHARFEAIAAGWREKGLDHNSGLQGRFRDRAHDLEDLAGNFKVGSLYLQLLQIRRREKDYLLRHDVQYVQMVQQEIQTLLAQVAQSGISYGDKQQLNTLINSYKTDFLALVKQNDIIGRLAIEMQDAARQITQAVERNVDIADRTMKETTETIHANSQANSRLMLVIVLVALLMGISFAIFITRYITRSLHRIGAVLGRMAHSDPTQRLSVTGGRDELDAMGAAVNTMNDQMERLIAWSMATTREDEAHLRSAVYSIPPGIFIADNDGIIEALNTDLAQMLGYPPSALIGQSLSRLLADAKSADQCQSLFDQVESHAVRSVDAATEVTGLSKHGEEMPLSITVGKVGRGENRRYIGLVLDITLRRQTEANWHQSLDQKQELLTNMSHDMDTLMDSIISMVDDLAETRPAAKRRRYAEIIKQSAQWLLDIVDVILGYSKIQTRWVRPEETDFDLYLLMDNLSFFFSNFARIKGIEYRVQRSANLPNAVVGDPENLNRVLVNLLSNAVKFTETGEVTIGAELVAEDEAGYQVRFTIQDTGIGIDAFKLDHLFEPHDRVSDVDTFDYKRPSQGLVITKQLVALLGGEIEVSGQPGDGTVATVSLPLKKARNADEASGQPDLS